MIGASIRPIITSVVISFLPHLRKEHLCRTCSNNLLILASSSAYCLRNRPSCSWWVEWYNQHTIGGATTPPTEAQGGACPPFGRIAR